MGAVWSSVKNHPKIAETAAAAGLVAVQFVPGVDVAVDASLATAAAASEATAASVIADASAASAAESSTVALSNASKIKSTLSEIDKATSDANDASNVYDSHSQGEFAGHIRLLIVILGILLLIFIIYESGIFGSLFSRRKSKFYNI